MFCYYINFNSTFFFFFKKLFLLSAHTPRSFLFRLLNPSTLPLILRGNRSYQG